jgi:protein phosphatase
MHFSIQAAAGTHVGRVRSQNEDSIAFDVTCPMVLLADGMGGHNAGEVASRMAVTGVSSGLRAALAGGSAGMDDDHAAALLLSEIAVVNRLIHEAGQAGECSGMATTLVAALWHRDRVTIAHVGDSRLYRLREGSFERVTRDHSFVEEQIERGLLDRAEARTAPFRNVVTRAVGAHAQVRPDVRTLEVKDGDLYLLCSDGLTEMLTDDDIASIIMAAGEDLDGAVERLVDGANRAGWAYNIAVVLVRALAAG